MFTVSIKDFQKNIYEYFKKVPLVITRRGIPFAKIEPFERNSALDVQGTISKAYKEVIEVQEKKGVEVCKHGMMAGVCKFGCK